MTKTNQMGQISKIQVIILVITGIVAGLFYLKSSQKTDMVNSQSPSGAEEMLIINGHGSSDNPSLTYQLKFPSKYYAVSDEMITSYKSQGGMAPPRLILTTNSQALAKTPEENQRYLNRDQNIEKGGSDCVLVWSTRGFTSIDDWTSLLGRNYEILSSQTSRMGNHDVLTQTVLNKDTNTQSMRAFIKVPQDVSYYFTSCNSASAVDLEKILESFDVRSAL